MANMPRFFTDELSDGTMLLTGDNGRHAAKALRLRPGERLTVCDGHKNEALCEVTETGAAEVVVKVLEKRVSTTEPETELTIYQAVPKGDRMDFVVQKAVELGVNAIVPMNCARCVAKTDGREEKKTARWQKIALEAAKQCERGIIPQVYTPVSYKEAIEKAKDSLCIFFYEGGGESLDTIVKKDDRKISIFIGPEGGYDDAEVELAKAAGMKIATLGPRILRTDTAPIAAAAIIMALTGEI